MIFILFTVLCVFICWRKGYWRRWSAFYPTMLYFFIGDTVSDTLLRQKPLWAFNALIYNYPVLDIALTAVLYPATVLLFLSMFPATRQKQIGYMLAWVAVYTVVEYVGYVLGDFIYFNGWNIGYSLVFNLIMFPMILLHYKKPLPAWALSAVLAFSFLWLMGIPLAR